MSVWRHTDTISGMGLEVGCFVEEYPEKQVGVQVTVDAHLMERMASLRPAVVAQFALSVARDVEMYFVAVKIIIDPIHRIGR